MMNKEELAEAIDIGALRELCIQYDIEYEDYPKSPYEGLAIYNFFTKIVLGFSEGIDWVLWEQICENTEKDNYEIPSRGSSDGDSEK